MGLLQVLTTACGTNLPIRNVRHTAAFGGNVLQNYFHDQNEQY